MLTITDALVAEHRLFTEMFDAMENLLPELRTAAEVRVLATLVERVLRGHAEAETNFAYAALDHVLKDHGPIHHLHQEHEEIDESLRRVHEASGFDEARRLFRMALDASRTHFQHEEQSIFPRLEAVLQPDTLAALGHARIRASSAKGSDDIPVTSRSGDGKPVKGRRPKASSRK